MQKGEKYVVEIAEIHTHYDDKSLPYSVARIKGFNSLFFDNYGLEKLEKLGTLENAYEKACSVIAWTQFADQIHSENDEEKIVNMIKEHYLKNE